jgi:trk system potassium uptake protein TrkH
VVLLAALMVAWEIRTLYLHGEPLLRTALFQVITIITTTGFATADFAIWNPVSQLMLLFLMFVGGCSGSTSGAIKIGRLRIILEQTANELKTLIHPRGIFSIHYGSRNLSDEVTINVLQFFFLYIIFFAVAGMITISMGVEYLTAFSGVAAMIGNVGPGLGAVGPMGNYQAIPDAGKWLFSFLMLLGRLEIYTVLVLASPAFWKR